MSLMQEPRTFVLRWLDDTSAIVTNVRAEFVVKPTLRQALASVGRRCAQSNHLIPEEAAGFYLCAKEDDVEYGD